MSKNKLLIGSHVSMSGPEFYLGSVKEALSYGSTTFMFYTGAPQNSIRKPLSELKIDEGRQLIKEAGINEDKIVVHAPYILNLANDSDLSKHDVSKRILKNELLRTQAFGCKILVLHPGAHVGKGFEYGIDKIALSIDEIYDSIPDCNVLIALETMAGKGSEVGVDFQQLATLISKSRHKDKLGVCLDTCHIHDAGYNIHDFDSILNEFDSTIGLNKLLVIHVNDSKNIVGAHKDRHENIGYGEIGFESLNYIVNHPKLIDVPKILETPYINEKPPYKKEIEMFKNQAFDKNWKDNF